VGGWAELKSISDSCIGKRGRRRNGGGLAGGYKIRVGRGGKGRYVLADDLLVRSEGEQEKRRRSRGRMKKNIVGSAEIYEKGVSKKGGGEGGHRARIGTQKGGTCSKFGMRWGQLQWAESVPASFRATTFFAETVGTDGLYRRMIRGEYRNGKSDGGLWRQYSSDTAMVQKTPVEKIVHRNSDRSRNQGPLSYQWTGRLDVAEQGQRFSMRRERVAHEL